MRKDLFLVGASDSIGVPYARDNVEHQGFFEMIADYFRINYNVVAANCFHMSTYNDNKYISQLIHQDISLYKIKVTQNQMLETCKYSGVYPYIELPKSFLNHYSPTEDDNAIIIRKYIEKYKTIFVYSAFTNDLLKSYGLSLFKLLRPGKIKSSLKIADTDVVFRELCDNISSLIKLNSNIEIYLIGLFVPTKIPYVRKNLSGFIARVNKIFREIADDNENVYFIDNSNLDKRDFNNIDFHPNKNGHTKIYRNFIDVYEVAHR